MNGSATPAEFCPPGTWGTSCSPCTPCPNGSALLHACARSHDNVCRPCHSGFWTTDGGGCEILREETGPYEVFVFLSVVLEILIIAAVWRWWRQHRTYMPVQPYES